MDSVELEQEASLLVGQLAQACARPEGTNSFSPSIYDTAWVAMVEKTVDGDRSWRFPECFRYVLDHQKSDGSWESYASEVDGILNTMAGLLALKVHLDTPQNRSSSLPSDIENRISNACAALENMLQHWDVQASVHVGFEILVPALLQSLEKKGFSFAIPGHRFLEVLNQKKLAKFDARILYGKVPTTLIHSLEAFTGRIDFDRVCHHKIGGSMMCSPSATAAYLINSSTWDYEAEEYLAQVVASSRHEVVGGIPSAYPTTIFMLTWVRI